MNPDDDEKLAGLPIREGVVLAADGKPLAGSGTPEYRPKGLQGGAFQAADFPWAMALSQAVIIVAGLALLSLGILLALGFALAVAGFFLIRRFRRR